MATRHPHVVLAAGQSHLGRTEAGGPRIAHRREALLGLGDVVVPVTRLVGDHRVLVALHRARPRARVPVAGLGPATGEAGAAGAARRAGAWVGARGRGARGVGAHVGRLTGVGPVTVPRVVAGDGVPLLDEA